MKKEKSNRASKSTGETVEVTITRPNGEIIATDIWPLDLWEALERRAKELGISIDDHISSLIANECRGIKQAIKRVLAADDAGGAHKEADWQIVRGVLEEVAA